MQGIGEYRFNYDFLTFGGKIKPSKLRCFVLFTQFQT